ncbi:prolipoprotein diacylglyceryl transferase [Alkalicoccobacillus murimartini]|uniref:Phosphatidylglycerol--prolipoprotein diacylglyceryl transferase n=1 Tax=Alkalicoccobacillus murimartini TaxID=171685 RepID=A0ABT9YFX3_9BACI|nr:prolipoprotein diacylglyceryl transferase [Alkalicoccobacillus murimartini]MDQ0206720.1 phosphatidylglycerol:prolipoprotein diacylglycerol transferase [Alkalicoccobacillus murimartini]
MDDTIQALDRVMIELGPITIYWYGAIIGLGVLLGYLLASRESKKRGLPKDIFADLLLFALPIAIISARIYYVIFRWDQFADDPIRVFYIWEGGIAIHGALIGSVITAIIFAKKRGISFWKLADVAAPSILLGQAIGRWGNFMNQEVYGSEVTREFLEGLQLPTFIIDQMYIQGTYYHPTFLYESILSFLGVVLLLWLRRVNLREGELFLGYVIWYSVARFFIEGIRLDYLLIGDVLRVAQLLSAVLVLGAIALIFYRRVKVNPPGYLDTDVVTKKKKK